MSGVGCRVADLDPVRVLRVNSLLQGSLQTAEHPAELICLLENFVYGLSGTQIEPFAQQEVCLKFLEAPLRD